jgi:CheY-like chemotaxis protein
VIICALFPIIALCILPEKGLAWTDSGPIADMETFLELENQLRDALGHLYDPSFWPTAALWAATGCDPEQGVECVQAAIIRAINSLQPAPDVPAHTRIRRLYDLLHMRYVQRLTSEETAQRLNITSRHLRREQQEAITVLVRRLTEEVRRGITPVGRPGSTPVTPVIDEEASQDQPPTWHAQLQQEMLSLQKSAPGSLADIGEALLGALEVGQTLAAKRGIVLSFGDIEPGLRATIHPSALRQALVASIGTLARNMSGGEITSEAKRTGERIAISITGQPVHGEKPSDAGLIGEIVAARGGSFEVQTGDGRVTFRLSLLSADEIVVLVVDDNADIVHFYRRYTADTRYRIVHMGQGLRVLETAESVTPHIIVLDIMLADMDGWQLLTQLHEHPATCRVPVIVCSVIKQDELALALGAVACLAKPVWRNDFVEALDRVAKSIGF